MSNTVLHTLINHEPPSKCVNLSHQANPVEYLERWKEVLAEIMHAFLEKRLDQERREFIKKIRLLNRVSLWPEMQLYWALQAFCCKLLDLPIPKGQPFQYSTGAAPLEYGGHWPWADAPHLRSHAEMGILWAFLGYVDLAEKLADWQMNALDYHFYPFVGLFSQESEGFISNLLVSQYLLFHTVAVLAGRPDLEHVAKWQLEHLKRLANRKATFFEIMCEAWTKQLTIDQQPIQLPKIIQDSETCLAGFRNSEYSLVSTLKGGGTGMGTLRRQGVQIMSYGPHHLPLGDCRGFGIEGGRNTTLNVTEQGFSMQGVVRVSPKMQFNHSFPLFRCGDPSGWWIDAKQTFLQGVLTIDTHFMGTGLENLAFAFFVKGEQCWVGKEHQVKPLSLDRYSGNVQNIRIEAKQARLDIIAEGGCKLMEVIPLGGGDNFWGADFLVAYLLNDQSDQYRWQIL